MLEISGPLKRDILWCKSGRGSCYHPRETFHMGVPREIERTSSYPHPVAPRKAFEAESLKPLLSGPVPQGSETSHCGCKAVRGKLGKPVKGRRFEHIAKHLAGGRGEREI